MDRNGGVDLQEETQESIDETLRWLEACHFEHIKPMITPRFTPSCTNELMAALGKIATEQELPAVYKLVDETNQIVRCIYCDQKCAQ